MPVRMNSDYIIKQPMTKHFYKASSLFKTLNHCIYDRRMVRTGLS